MAKKPRIFLAFFFIVFGSSLSARAQSETTNSPTKIEQASQQQDASQSGAIKPALPQPAQQTTPTPPGMKLTLEDALGAALTQHPSLRQARQAIVAAEARTKQAKSAYFPQLSTSGIAKQGLSGASGALNLRGLVTSPLFRDIGSSAAAFQNLYDFGRTTHQVKASRWVTVSLNHALEAEQALIALNVQQAYYAALQQQRLIKVEGQILANRQLIVRQAAAFYKAGLKSKLDLTLAEVGVSNANLELTQTRDRLNTAFAELNHAMGIEGEATYALEEPKIEVKSPPTLESLSASSQSQRPEMLAFDAQIKADEEIVARAKSNRWPKLMLMFSSGWVRFSDYSPGKLLLGAFGIDMPLFTGGRIKGEIEEAQANLAQARGAREGMAQDIRVQVQRAHNEFLSALEAIKANEQLIAQAREALRLAQVRYRVNVGSFVELNTAEAVASNAEAQYAQALYRYKMAEALLNYAANRR